MFKLPEKPPLPLELLEGRVDAALTAEENRPVCQK